MRLFEELDVRGRLAINGRGTERCACLGSAFRVVQKILTFH